MPARALCQKFFRRALAPFYQYRQNALLDATVALTRGASLSLTSIGSYLPGTAQVKNKIKRVDRLPGRKTVSVRCQNVSVLRARPRRQSG